MTKKVYFWGEGVDIIQEMWIFQWDTYKYFTICFTMFYVYTIMCFACGPLVKSHGFSSTCFRTFWPIRRQTEDRRYEQAISSHISGSNATVSTCLPNLADFLEGRRVEFQDPALWIHIASGSKMEVFDTVETCRSPGGFGGTEPEKVGLDRAAVGQVNPGSTTRSVH